jgi:hypothetical protein
MIGIVRSLVELQWAQRGLLGVWWCALYHSAFILSPLTQCEGRFSC